MAIVDYRPDDNGVLARVYNRLNPAVGLLRFENGELVLQAMPSGILPVPAYVHRAVVLLGSARPADVVSE